MQKKDHSECVHLLDHRHTGTDDLNAKRCTQSSNYDFSGSSRNRYFRCLAYRKDFNAAIMSAMHSWNQSVMSRSIEGSPALLFQVTGP